MDLVIFFGFTAIVIFAFAAVFRNPRKDAIAEVDEAAAESNDLIADAIRAAINYYDASVKCVYSSAACVRSCAEWGQAGVDRVRACNDLPPEFEAACIDVEAACREANVARIEIEIEFEAFEKKNHSISVFKGSLDPSSFKIIDLSIDYGSIMTFFERETGKITVLIEKLDFIADQLNATVEDFFRLVGLPLDEESDDASVNPALPGPEAGIKARAA